MPDKWIPVEAVRDFGGEYQLTYRNTHGEEYVHVTEGFYDHGNPRAFCWSGCSGDWPGCRMKCPAFTQTAEQMLAEQKEYETVPPYDPFSFMLNHTEDIDERNFYVEKFDTLDGIHWELAVDVQQRIQDILDQKSQDLP